MTNFIRSVEAANQRAAELKRSENVIPEGLYCYKRITDMDVRQDGNPVFKTDVCPYWGSDPTKDEQESGYCAYLKSGDWESGLGLLWDLCKECGINENLDDVLDSCDAELKEYG
jgi:hypothetical protein